MLTFLSYNLHSGKDSRGAMNLDAMIETIREAQPDLAAVQEVACHVSSAGNIDEAALLRDGLGMHMLFVPAISYNGGDYGIGLLSRHPILSARAYHIPDIPEGERDRWFEHRIILCCDIGWNGQTITVLTTHLGLSEGERRNGVSLLCRLIDEAKHPVIVAGDLNTRPEESLLQPLLTRVQMHSSACTYPEKTPECKIDYILVSPEWHVENEHPLPSLASDHLPLVKSIRL